MVDWENSRGKWPFSKMGTKIFQNFICRSYAGIIPSVLTIKETSFLYEDYLKKIFWTKENSKSSFLNTSVWVNSLNRKRIIRNCIMLSTIMENENHSLFHILISFLRSHSQMVYWYIVYLRILLLVYLRKEIDILVNVLLLSIIVFDMMIILAVL